MVGELERGQCILECWGRTGGVEAENWRKMCLSPLFPPPDLMMMRMNLPRRCDFRAQLLLDGATLLHSPELFPWHVSPGSSSRSPSSDGQMEGPMGWVALGKGAGQAGCVSALPLTGRCSVLTGWLCLCQPDLESCLWTRWPLRECGRSALPGSHSVSFKG